MRVKYGQTFLQVDGSILHFLLTGNHVKQQQTKGRQQHQATGSSNGNAVETLIIAAYSDDEGRTALLQRMGNDTLFSTLTLSSVAIEDSGQYRCSPANMASAVVSFHVVIGEFGGSCTE